MQLNTTQTIVYDSGNASPGRYLIWVKNTGANPLTAFSIQGRNSTKAEWVDIVDDFLTASSFLEMTSDTIDPKTLAAGTEWNAGIINNTFKCLRIIAAGNTSIDIEVSCIDGTT